MLFNINKEEIKQKINHSEWINNSYQNMIKLCEPLMKAERPYDITTEKAVASAGRSYGARISMLITAGMVVDEAYTHKAKDMLLYAAETGDLEYYKSLNGHLAVADTAFTYAICYDLLSEYLSEDEKTLIKNAMEELAIYLYECNTTWRLPHSGVTSCNHNAVHHGALGLCAMILENDKWFSFAVERTRGFFETFVDKTGYVTEGVSYSFYGLTNALMFSEAYYNRTGIDLINDYSNMKEISNQLIEHVLPRYDCLLSLNDHHKYVGNSAPFIYLASRFGYSEGLYLWKTLEEGNKFYGSGSHCDFRSGIVFPFLIHWANEKLPLLEPSALNRPLSKKFDSGRIMMRTAWDDKMATFVSFTCGKDFHRGHNHPDQNSFTVYAMGEDFLIDPGTYGNDSRSHNLVMVNGYGQQYGSSKGEIKVFKDNGRFVKITGDATEAYIWIRDTLVGYAARHLTFIRYPYPLIIIRDDIQTELGQEKFYEFMMHTIPENEFYKKDKSLYIKGHNYGNLCKIDMVHPEAVDINICDKLERKSSHFDGKHDVGKLQKEASISTTGLNPFFTSVISFAECEEDMPKISCEQEGEILKLKIDFKDGYSESVDVERFDMQVINGFSDNNLRRKF